MNETIVVYQNQLLNPAFSGGIFLWIYAMTESQLEKK